MFKVNQTYTKKQIYVIAGVPEIQQGGHWHTGIPNIMVIFTFLRT